MNVFLITTIVAVAVGFGAGYRTANQAADARELQRVHAAQAEYKAVEDRYDDAAWELEAARAELATQRANTAAKLSQIASRDSYQHACLDADGVQLFNESLRDSAAANPSEPSYRMSKNDASR